MKICDKIGWLLGLIIIPLFLNGCNNAPDVSDYQNKGYINGSPFGEFNYQGCQYIWLDRGIAHKGNCTNSIHIYNKK